MINAIDGLLLALIGGTMVWGWYTGVLRQIVAISAAMIAFMVAKLFYQQLGAWFGEVAMLSAPNFFEGPAYLLLFFLVAAGWFMIVRRAYPYTRLVEPERGGRGLVVDRVGGVLLGGALGVLLAIALVGVIELWVFYRWPILLGSGPRSGIHGMVHDSALVGWLFRESPETADLVGSWVPGVAVAREGRIQP